jgi:hypothetical protein
MGDYFEVFEDDFVEIPVADRDDFDAWLRELGEILHTSPESLLGLHLDVKDLLFDGGASPAEAADFLRVNLY